MSSIDFSHGALKFIYHRLETPKNVHYKEEEDDFLRIRKTKVKYRYRSCIVATSKNKSGEYAIMGEALRTLTVFEIETAHMIHRKSVK